MKTLIDPEIVLFGKSLNTDIKIEHKVEVIGKQIVIHQDQFTTKRFNEIMAMAKRKNTEE